MNLSELDALVASGYPRPQLVRSDWTDLCGEWEFAFDDGDVGLDQRWYLPGSQAFDRSIRVPFPPESISSRVNDNGFHPVVWYRRRIAPPPHGARDRVLLHFGAVDYEAEVFLDGQRLGSHEGGQTPFEFDVTALCGSEQVALVVRVVDRPTDAHQPRGKQDWRAEPHRIWYKRTTGIWQPVWLEVVPREHIVALDFEADLADGVISLRVELAGEVPGGTLRLRLSFGDEVIAEHTESVWDGHVRLVCSPPALENAWDWERFQWSPSSPQLLGAEISFVAPDGVTTDSVRSYLGLRSVRVVDRRFTLNGRPQYLKMVLTQGYWSESHLAAPDNDALRAEVELIKAIGFNGVRLHQKVEDPRFLYWADRLGLLVWEEMPSASAFSPRAIQQVVREWMKVVERDRGHPCVIAWVPFNESWGVPALSDRSEQRDAVRAVYHLTHALDATRPVVTNDGWEHVESDIWGIHDYARTGEVLRRRYGDSVAMARVLSDRWPSSAKGGSRGYSRPGPGRHVDGVRWDRSSGRPC